jgi:hypothetical protein
VELEGSASAQPGPYLIESIPNFLLAYTVSLRDTSDAPLFVNVLQGRFLPHMLFPERDLSLTRTPGPILVSKT